MQNRKNGMMVVCLIVLVFMAACSNSNTGSENAANDSTPAPSTGATETAAESGAPQEEYVIQVLYEGGKEVTRSDEQPGVGQVIKEKFNIVFEWIPFAGDYAEHTNIMLASGDYPELLILRSNEQVRNYIDAGALLPLDDYLGGSEYFTKTYETLIPYWKMTAPDKKLYKWETNVLNTVGVPTEVGVRIDLLKEQGWPLLHSATDYVNFLKTAQQNHPDVDGKPSFGMVYPGANLSGVWFPRIAAFAGDQYYQSSNDHNIIYNIKTQQYENYLNDSIKESLKFFNNLHQAGLLDDENFTDQYENMVDKLKSGQAFGQMNSRFGGQGDANRAMIDNGTPERQYINMPIQLDSQIARNEKSMTLAAVLRPLESVVMTKKAKHPERIFELLDWAASDEAQLLIQSGVEGVDYLRDGNGIRYRTEEMWSNWSNPEYVESIGHWQHMTLLGRVTTSPVDGQFYRLRNVSYHEVIQEALDQYGWEQASDWYKENGFVHPLLIEGLVSIDPASEMGRLGMQIKELINREQTGLIRAANDEEFERLWSQLVENYNRLNPQRFTDAHNEQLAAIKSEIDALK